MASNSQQLIGKKSKDARGKEFLYVCIDPADYDESRLVHDDPQKETFKVGQTEVNTTVSQGFYLDDNNEKCVLYFRCGPQSQFGVNESYDLGKEGQPDALKGYQVMYPLTTMATVNNPTEDEQAIITLVDSLYENAVTIATNELARKPKLLPPAALGLLKSAADEGDIRTGIKKPYEHPKDEKTKKIDETKPVRMYIKLITSGKGKSIKVVTKFYGPGDVQENPKKHVGSKEMPVRGILEPIVKYEGMYWGQHGADSPCGASLRFRIDQANFTRSSGVSSLGERLLPKNTSKRDTTEDGEENRDTEGGEEEPDENTFAKVSNGKTQTAVLSNVVKANKAKKTIPAKTPSAKTPAKPKTIPAKASTKTSTKAPKSTVPAAKPKTTPAKKPAPKKVPIETEDEEQTE